MTIKTNLRAGLAFAVLATAAAPALADATINVRLWDKEGDMAENMGLGMKADMATAIMGLEIDKASVPAGKVTFEVTNGSAETIHEMLVAPIASLDVTLPYVADENRVDEEAAGGLGEVSELDPGKSGALTLDLAPGYYVMFCNIPGHFMTGMWTTFEVTK